MTDVLELKVGDIILATDENRALQVGSILTKGTSKYIDFVATYLAPAGFDKHGNMIYGIRGFKLDGENWELIESAESAQAKPEAEGGSS